MHGYKAFSCDTKADMMRLCTKVDQLKAEHKDPHGVQYVKDFVRQTFVFSSVNELVTAFEAFVNNRHHVVRPRCGIGIDEQYTIIEVKSKLTTPLQNITLVVMCTGMIIGELQLRVEQRHSADDIFLDHWLYELKRMFDEPDIRKIND